MSSSSILRRLTHPPILPIPSRTTGNNVPHSLHKTRRTWRPNVGRHSLPVNVLDDAAAEHEAVDARLQAWAVATEQRALDAARSAHERVLAGRRAKGSTEVADDVREAAQRAGAEAADAVRAAAKAKPLRMRRPELRGVKMAMADIRSVDKAGGIEAALLSRPAKHFTPYGRKLRHDLFRTLLAQRDHAREADVERTHEQRPAVDDQPDQLLIGSQ